MLRIIYKKIGKIFNNKRNIILLLFFISILVLSASFSISKKYLKLQACQNKLTHLKSITLNSLENRKKVNDFINEHLTYDKFYIDNNLENMKFLQKENNILNKLLEHPAFCNNQQIKNRIDFINSEQNILKFAEENVTPGFKTKETIENQLYAIEADDNDLQNILSAIESSQTTNVSSHIGAPQLILLNFVLEKEKKNTFLINMKLLKREYLKK